MNDSENTLSQPSRVLLVRALAIQQVAWLPIRKDWARAPAIHARRRGEVSISLGGGRAADRESVSYWAAELAARGLMIGRSLTPAGKRLARSWTWPFVPSELKLAARRLRSAAKRGDVHPDSEQFAPDSFITGRFWDEQTALLQKCFLPWLADGILLSATDAPGFVYYGQPDPAANLSKLASNVIDLDIGFDKELSQVYQSEFKRARHSILSDSRSYSELGELPLALVELKSGRNPGDPPRLKAIFEVESHAEVACA